MNSLKTHVRSVLIGLLGFGAFAVHAGQGPQPSICTRACWGARNTSCTANMGALTRAIIHHTADPNHINTSGLEASKSMVRGTQNYHMDSRGYCDIAYHFLVDKWGNIFEGRKNSMSGLPQGAHDGANYNSFGFTMLGYYHPPYNNQAPASQRNALYDVIAWRMPSSWSSYGAGSYNGVTVGYLDGHRKVKATACPGDTFHPVYITENYNGGEARDGVNARKNSPPPATFGPNHAVIRNDDGRLQVFAIGSDTVMYHNWQWTPGGSWSGWISLGGGFFSQVVAAKNADGRPQVFAIGGNGVPHTAWQNADGTWSGWMNMGGAVKSLAVAMNPDGRLELFGVGTDTVMYHNWQSVPNGGWSGWFSMGGGYFIDRLAVGANADGRLQVFTININNLCYSSWQQVGGGWSAWSSMGGSIKELAVERNTDGRMEVFGVGTDTVMYHTWQTAPNGGWSGFFSLGGGFFVDKVAVNKNADGRLQVFTLNVNGTPYSLWQSAPGAGWGSTWWNMGGVLRSIAVAQNSDGRMEAFGTGSDSVGYHNWQGAPNGGWSGWAGLGGSLK